MVVQFYIAVLTLQRQCLWWAWICIVCHGEGGCDDAIVHGLIDPSTAVSVDCGGSGAASM